VKYPSEIIKEIKGINALNDGEPRKIIYVNNSSFKIGDDINYENYRVGGMAEKVVLSKEMKYKKLKDCFYISYPENKFPDINDYWKEVRNELLHLSLLAIHKY
jgi:ubiquitin-activating enzyme E1